jgi:hypothetical protein
MRWSDDHLLHVGIFDGVRVLEVQGDGLVRSDLQDRKDKLDIVLRFDLATRQKIQMILNYIPVIHFKYPQESIGIDPRPDIKAFFKGNWKALPRLISGSWYAKGELVQTPARPSRNLRIMTNHVEADRKLTEWFKVLKHIGKTSISLEELNTKLEELEGPAVREFVCSHAVHAILLQAVWPDTFATCLSDWERCAVSPAQLFRMFRDGKGVFAHLEPHLVGVAYKGKFVEDETLELWAQFEKVAPRLAEDLARYA